VGYQSVRGIAERERGQGQTGHRNSDDRITPPATHRDNPATDPMIQRISQNLLMGCTQPMAERLVMGLAPSYWACAAWSLEWLIGANRSAWDEPTVLGQRETCIRGHRIEPATTARIQPLQGGELMVLLSSCKGYLPAVGRDSQVPRQLSWFSSLWGRCQHTFTVTIASLPRRPACNPPTRCGCGGR